MDFGFNQNQIAELQRKLAEDASPNSIPLGDADLAHMPTMGDFTAYQEHELEQILQNYKLTPATMAFRLENRKVQPQAPLKWYPSPFLMNISLKIALGVAKGGARIIISAPPRHGKSRLSTIHAPLWVLENFADKNVVTTTYGADLSEDFARVIRDFIVDCPDLLDVRLRDDANKLAKFLTSKGGALTSIGVGGPITGRGADVLLIDDYIKQIKEALSATYRQYVWDWFTTTAMTRLEPNASVIIVATRWHHDDLIGRIIKEFGTKEEGGDWDYIKYHAIAREGDILGRKPGEALFPERYPIAVLNERKKLLGSIYFDAIFDQEPRSNDSDLTNKSWIIKRSIVDLPPRPLRLVRVWDFAGTESAKSDFTAGGLLGADDAVGASANVRKSTGLLHMVRKQITAAKVEALVIKVAESDGPDVPVVICQETGSAGKAIVAHYQNNVIPQCKVTGYYWNTQKVVVAQPWLAATEAGDFWILEADWNKEFIDEFGQFPTEGANIFNDQIDCCSNGYIFLHGKKRLGVTWASKKKGSIIPVNPVLAAQLLANKAEFSPQHALAQLQGSKKWRFGTVKGATWGRRKG